MSSFTKIPYNSPVFSGIHAIALNPKRSDHRGYTDRIYFPDEPVLRGKKIKALKIFGSVQISTVPVQNGYWMDSTPISSDVLANYITLCDDSGFEFWKDMPCGYLSQYAQMIPIDREVDLLDSYIRLGGDYDTDQTYLFLFFYEQDDQSYLPRTNTNMDSIEFALNAVAGEKSYLPNYPPLEGKKIRNIYLQSSSFTGGSAQTPNGYAVADLQSKYITLIHRRTVLFWRVPAYLFVQYNEMFRYRMADIQVTLSDSYVETSPADYTTPGSLLFSFEYSTK